MERHQAYQIAALGASEYVSDDAAICISRKFAKMSALMSEYGDIKAHSRDPFDMEDFAVTVAARG